MAVFPAEERDDGWVYLKLPPVHELDNVLGTKKWEVKAEEREDPFASLDKKLGLKKGLRGMKIGAMPGTGNVTAGREVAVNAAPRIDW